MIPILLKATLWDRAFGGATMIIHIEGATAPNTPSAPEYIKAFVYLPPSIVSEIPSAQTPTADMVQSFIENVGVHTQAQWERVG